MSAQEKLSFINDPNLRVLISEDELRARVRQMGAQITRDYAGKNLHLLASEQNTTAIVAPRL